MSPTTTAMTTASVLDQNTRAYWQDAVNHRFGPVAVAPRNDSGPFAGRLAVRDVGYLRVATLEADAQRLRRGSRLAQDSAESHITIGLLAAGSASMTQDGRSTGVGRGDLVIFDGARPYSFDFPERFVFHLFLLPRRAMTVPENDLRHVTAKAIRPDQGVAAMLAPVLTVLASGAPCTASVGNRLAGNVADLVATLVTEHVELLPEPDAATSHLALRIRNYINRQLADTELSPESIARAHGISVRYLHRIFESEGITVSRLIRRRRLEECCRELARPNRAKPTVSAVAQRWGFVNAAHFSRTFKAAYGVTPREWRSGRQPTASLAA